MDPPHTPLRPAIGVTGTTASLQADSTADDLVRGVRSHDDGRALGDRPLGRPADGQGPPVAAGFGPAGPVGPHVGAAGDQAIDQAGRWRGSGPRGDP
jgi:hypothetical protein